MQETTTDFDPWQAESPWPKPQTLPPELPPVRAFPPDALPDSLRPWAVDVADRLGAPIEICAVAAVVCAGAALGRGVGVRPKMKDSWQEYPNLWGLCIGQPSTMKSPALAEMLRPLQAIDAARRTAWEPLNEQYQNQWRDWKTDLDAVQAENKKRAGQATRNGTRATDKLPYPPEPERPPCPRILVSDTTVEKLTEIANENPRGLLLFRDELAAWLASFNRAGRESDRAFYLETASGKTGQTVDRIGRGTLHCPPLALGVLGGVQPDILRKILTEAGDALNDGLAQRFSLAVWPDAPGEYRMTDTAPNAAARELFAGTLERLAKVNAGPHPTHGETDQFSDRPFLRFSPDAAGLFSDWFSEHVNGLRNGQAAGPLESHLAKYGKTVCGLALIATLADQPQATAVDARALSKALSFAAVLSDHARRVYSPATNSTDQTARLLAAKITAREIPAEFSARDVYRHGWTGLTDPDAVADGLKKLAALDWLLMAGTDRTGPGRPTQSYTINPRILDK